MTVRGAVFAATTAMPPLLLAAALAVVVLASPAPAHADTGSTVLSDVASMLGTVSPFATSSNPLVAPILSAAGNAQG